MFRFAFRFSSAARQEPAALSSNGNRIRCAKCGNVRGDPDGNKPKSLVRKESYWFCESCVSENPDVFTGRRISISWDGGGRWLTATVRVRMGVGKGVEGGVGGVGG